jgi:hypothetical protein
VREPQVAPTVRTIRVPIGLRSEAVLAGGLVEIVRRPDVIFRPLTFVLPPDVARSFELVSFHVGAPNAQTIERSPLPLTTFSVEFCPTEDEPARLALQEWTMDACEPWNSLTLRLRRLPQCYTHTDCWALAGHEPVGQTCAERVPFAFSGLLWGRAA